MQIEIIIIAIIVFVVMTVGGQININQLISDNQMLFLKLKESDYDFYLRARYGNNVNTDIMFNKRIKNALLVMILGLFISIQNLSAITILIIFIVGYFVYKIPYNDLRRYYNSHMHEIDSMLPHYLKNMEILIQHYTVPVAIGKSMAEAPEIFKDGLQEMIDAINSGDDTIEPYMQFARRYPVRDSMRMMRLLYRLSLGNQDKKQEQLLMFSRTVSNLQNKSREQKYAERLSAMEQRTMVMLFVTGGGIMLLMLLSMMMMMNY